MKTLKESLLADIASNIKKGNDIALCNHLFSNNKKHMNDAIIDLMNTIEKLKSNKIDIRSLNKIKHTNNYIVKVSVIDDKYNLSICKFVGAGIWNIINIFSSNTTVTMYAWANWEDALQLLSTAADHTIIYEIESNELNSLFDIICNNAKEYIVD